MITGKKLLFFLLIVLSFQWSSALNKISVVPKKGSKKKMLILMSKGGYGHVAATNKLKQLFSEKYDISVANGIEEAIEPIGFVKMFRKREYDGMYNSWLQGGWNKATNFIARGIAPHLFRFYRRTIEKQFTKLLRKHNPDLLVSVIPFINRPAANAAANLNIPYLLITTDMDITNWCYGLDKIQHDNFKVTIGIDIYQTKQKLLERNIPESNIIHTGFPLREDFFEKKDHAKIKKEWNIPDNKFTIMTLMGGQGSQATYDYISTMAKLDVKAHLLACIGRDKKMAEKLSKLTLPKNLSMTIVPFTKRISDLMSISNLMITKPGPGSLYEAMQMNVPVIIDYTKIPLFWEKACINLVRDNNFGVALKKYRHLNRTVKKFVNDKAYYQSVVSSIKKYPMKSFNDNIRKIVTEMMG